MERDEQESRKGEVEEGSKKKDVEVINGRGSERGSGKG